MDADRIADSAATKNVSAFLDMIATCEGTFDAGADGYRMLIGGRIIQNLRGHPGVAVPFKQTDGTVRHSTAFGRYQFIKPTWDRVAAKLGLPDMSPNSQDQAAMELLAECGAMPLVKSGDLFGAIEKAAPVWASLPGSKYKQRTRSTAFALAAFIENGGALA